MFITADVAAFQADVRNRWPDGSVKFAVMSGIAPFTQNVAKQVQISSTGTASAGAPIVSAVLSAVTATVSFGAGSASFSSLDWGSPFRTTTSGPVMSSWTYRKPIGSDAHLVAWLEVRAYANGAVEVMPWIENSYLNVAGPTAKSGRTEFTLNGSVKYDSINDSNYTSAYGVTVVSGGTITLAHHRRIVLVSGGRASHWTGTDPQITPAHDRAYFQNTKLVPRYMPTAVNSTKLNALTSYYSPMRTPYTTDGMGGGGDEAYDIGLLPQTLALYITSPEARTYRAALAHGFALGSFAIHHRDHLTNNPLLFGSYPTLSTNSGTTPPTPSGVEPTFYASSHHPCSAYLPYLLTGWRWFLEEVQFQVTDHYLARNASARNNANGLFASSASAPGHNEQSGLRAQGWQWRTAAACACITPDAETTMRGQFVTLLEYNANYKRVEHETGAVGRSTAPNTLGWSVEPGAYNDGGYQITAPWQDDFITASIGFLWDLDVVTDTAKKADLLWYRNHKYKCPVGRGGQQNVSTDYNYRYVHQYRLNTGPYSGESFTWFSNWGEVFQTSLGIPNSGLSGTDLTGGAGIPTLFISSYYGDFWVALCYAVEHGATGAAAAYARFTGASNYSSLISLGDTDPRRAILPRNT